MITLGAIVPHSPLLAPRIGKERRDELRATLLAYQQLEEHMYARGIETLVIVSPHAKSYPEAFSGNMAEHFTCTLKTFGDHETAIDIPCDILTLDRIQHALRAHTNTPFTLTTSQELDYGFTIPILLLSEHFKDLRVVPISPSLLSAGAHVDFGRALRPILQESGKRIAVIASADLSHKLDPNSPTGANVEGPAFDATIRAKLKTMDVAGLLNMDPEAVEAAGQCGYRPIMTLMGVFDGVRTTQTELCYESPFGVGYLTELIEPVS